MSGSQNQVALPPVPLPQFASDQDFSHGGVDFFNTTIASIVTRVNALAPVNPKINLKLQFLAQFRADDFNEEELRFINTQLTSIVNNTNSLTGTGATSVPPVQLVQLKTADFKKAGIPEVCQFLTAIIKRLNLLSGESESGQ